MATATSDRIRKLTASVRQFLKGLAHAGLLSFVLNVTPAPASRPKVGRWGTYYGKTYERFRRAAQEAAAGRKGKPHDGPLVVIVETVVARPKTGKLEYPKGDVDNYAKGPLDALTQSGTFWWDDDQVVALFATKRYAAAGEDPRVVVDWIPLN